MRALNVCPNCGDHRRISAQEYIDLLVDEGSWHELDQGLRSADPLKFENYRERMQAAIKKAGPLEAIRTGYGRLDGLPINLGVMDFAFMGGSMGSVVGEKVARLARRSIDRHVPLVIVSASGGARMQEGVLSLMQMAKTSVVMARAGRAARPLHLDPDQSDDGRRLGLLRDAGRRDPRRARRGGRASPGRASSSRPSGRTCPRDSRPRSSCWSTGWSTPSCRAASCGRPRRSCCATWPAGRRRRRATDALVLPGRLPFSLSPTSRPHQMEPRANPGVARGASAIRSGSFPRCTSAARTARDRPARFWPRRCARAGFRVGLYTSPHLVSVRERVLVDGVPMSEEAFAEWTAVLEPHIERDRGELLRGDDGHRLRGPRGPRRGRRGGRGRAGRPARQHQRAHAAGERRDARSRWSTPTTWAAISATIAREKAGIAKPGVPFVTGEQDPAVRQVLVEEAQRLGAQPVVRVTPGKAPEGLRLGLAGRAPVGQRLGGAGDAQRPAASVRPGGPWLPPSFAEAYIPGPLRRAGSLDLRRGPQPGRDGGAGRGAAGVSPAAATARARGHPKRQGLARDAGGARPGGGPAAPDGGAVGPGTAAVGRRRLRRGRAARRLRAVRARLRPGARRRPDRRGDGARDRLVPHRR